ALPAAQQSTNVWKIGVLVSSSRELNAGREEALRRGLSDLGYQEGKNITTEYRYAEGQVERLPELAAELVHAGVDIIISSGTRATVAAKEATSAIPIVAPGAGGLAEAGVVRSLSHPGGNVTGVSLVSPDLLGKRLNLLREAAPKMARVATLGNPDTPGHNARVRDMELGARAYGLGFQSVAARK